ncbi:MAG: 50S ribosomal protein L29 [Candidatus Sungbacteria bacterium]|nr:50S ribosomal protein L29 [Candidatus Sungbacteria bacterium]
MKITELRQKSAAELAELLTARQTRIDELLFLYRQKRVKNVKEQAWLKKDVARILTLQRSPL